MSFFHPLDANMPRKELVSKRLAQKWFGRTTTKELPAPKLIGRTAHKSFKRICDLVTNGQSRIIGVQGMTGVGKTAIMMNVYNQLRDTQSDQFDKVIWASLSYNQEDLGHVRELLENKKRILLFVEDVREETYLALLHAIKPNRENGCKLLFATRSVDVCTRMGCKEDCIVKVELLSEIEALELFWDIAAVKANPTPRLIDIIEEVVKKCACLFFWDNAVVKADPTPRMIDIAVEVVKQCACLPLMIVAVGKKFRLKNESQWAKLLSEMRNSDDGILIITGKGIMNRVFITEGWHDISMLCALYPKDWKIPTKELITYMVALVDGGEELLISLKSKELLKSVEVDFEGNHQWGEGVQLQPLYRNVALMDNGMISKCGLMMEELLEEIKDHRWASFMCNNIRTISISPKCPKLSVLFLNKNLNLCTISHHFFVHMTGLRILDLRDNLKMETLPDSISDLIDLRVLRLSRCRSLKQVPSLAKLLHMQMLELDKTAIEELPHGIEMLVELTVLKLHSLSLREAIPNDYLSMLCSLLHLELHL